MPEHLNRGDVRRRLDRLRDEYADLPVRESAGTVPADRFERLRAKGGTATPAAGTRG